MNQKRLGKLHSLLRPQNAHLPQQPPFAPAGMARNGQVKRASDAVRNGHQSTWPKRTWITLGNLSQVVFLKLDLEGNLCWDPLIQRICFATVAVRMSSLSSSSCLESKSSKPDRFGMKKKQPGFNPPKTQSPAHVWRLWKDCHKSTVIGKNPKAPMGSQKTKNKAVLLEDSTVEIGWRSYFFHKNAKLWVQQASAVKSFPVKDVDLRN